MAHRVFRSIEGTTAYVAGATDGLVWLREEKDGKHALVALDVETGAEKRRWPMESGRPYVPSFVRTRTGALVLDGELTSHFDVAHTGDAARFRGLPLFADAARDIAVLVGRDPHSLVQVSVPDLGIRTRNAVTGYPPSFGTFGTSVAGKHLYRTNDKVVCADDDTLRIGWVHSLGVGKWEFRIFSSAGRAFAAELVDTREGPTTRISDWDLRRGTLTETLTLRGRMTANSDGGDFLVAEMEHADESTEVVAWWPGDESPAFVVPIKDRGWVEQCQVHGSLGAAVHRGGVEVFALRDGRLLGTRVPLPDRYTPTVAVHGNRVFAIADAIYSIDAGALPFDTEMKAHDTAFAGSPPVTVPASAFDVQVYEKPKGRNADVLRECAERFGFVVPPLLAKMLELYDTNPVVRGWIRASGLEMGVSGYSECWLGVDPALLGFAGDGSGQQWALYVYPPAIKDGKECGVVYWDHETREVSWCGKTFELFLAEHLERMETEEPDKLAFLLEALGLPPDFPIPDRSTSWPPPDFFQTAHSDVTRTMTLDAASKAIEASPVVGERALVAYVRENENDDTGIAMMEQLYEQLGWRYHRENLRQMKHVAKR